MAWQFYTKGRRVPTLIGKDSSGRRIWGGPYTALQVLAAPAIPVLAWNTQGLWAGSLSLFGTVVAIAFITVAGVKLLGHVDFAARNPLYVMYGYLKQTADLAPAGRCAGRKVAPPTTRRITSRINTSTRQRPSEASQLRKASTQDQAPHTKAQMVPAAENDDMNPAPSADTRPEAIQHPPGTSRMSGLEAFLEGPHSQQAHQATQTKEAV